MTALSCSAETFELGIDPISRERRVSTALTRRGFIFGWGDAADVREQARMAEIAQDSEVPTFRALTSDERSARSVRVSDGYAVWIDDEGTGEDYVIRGNDTRSGEARYETLSSSSGEHREPLLFQVDEGWLVAWVVSVGGAWRIELATISEEGRVEGERTRLPWTLPSPYFAMSLSDDQYYMSWNNGGDIVVAVMNAEGDVVTEPVVVSNGEAVPGESSIAFAQGFGVVAYSVIIENIRREVRARLLGPDGTPVRPEQVVSLAPLRGRNPVAAAFGGGYAVAYRASQTNEDEHLRVAFVHGSDGNVIDEYRLGAAPFGGEQPGVSVDTEGALAVGWASIESRGTAILGARLQCDDAWLRCGVER